MSLSRSDPDRSPRCINLFTGGVGSRRINTDLILRDTSLPYDDANCFSKVYVLAFSMGAILKPTHAPHQNVTLSLRSGQKHRCMLNPMAKTKRFPTAKAQTSPQ